MRGRSHAGLEPLEPRLCMDSALQAGAEQMYVGAAARGAAVSVDLDRDGDLDLVVWQRPLMTVLLNNGNGAFEFGGTAAIRGQPLKLAAGDFDGDGDDDLVALGRIGASTVLQVYRNDGDAGLVKLGQQRTLAGAVLFAAAGEEAGADELVLWREQRVSLHRVSEAGRIELVRPLVVSSGTITRPTLIDFDADGSVEALLVGVNEGGDAALLEVSLSDEIEVPRVVYSTSGGTIDGVIARETSQAGASGPGVAITVTRPIGEDRDHHVMVLDLPAAIGMSYGEPESVYVTRSTMAQTSGDFQIDQFLTLLAVADVDDDGDAEVMLTHRTESSNSRYGTIYFPTSVRTLDDGGDGVWTIATRRAVHTDPPRIYWIADMNGDGLPDLVRVRDSWGNGPLRIAISFNVPVM